MGVETLDPPGKRRFQNESLSLTPENTMYHDSTGIKASICGGSARLKSCFPGFKVYL